MTTNEHARQMRRIQRCVLTLGAVGGIAATMIGPAAPASAGIPLPYIVKSATASGLDSTSTCTMVEKYNLLTKTVSLTLTAITTAKPASYRKVVAVDTFCTSFTNAGPLRFVGATTKTANGRTVTSSNTYTTTYDSDFGFYVAGTAYLSDGTYTQQAGGAF